MNKIKLISYGIKALKYVILFIFISISAITTQAQSFSTIAGKITDDKNETMPGVTISIKGTTDGTISDLDGLYQMEVKQGNVLVFSFIGMQSEERIV